MTFLVMAALVIGSTSVVFAADKVDDTVKSTLVTTAEGLTDAELAEQKQLRADYVKAFRENLRGQLESIKIQNPDGSLIDVKARHDEKMKRLAEEQAEKGN